MYEAVIIKQYVSPLSLPRISKSTMDFIRFEGEVENRGVVKILLAKLDGKSIKLSGFTDILKVTEMLCSFQNVSGKVLTKTSVFLVIKYLPQVLVKHNYFSPNQSD